MQHRKLDALMSSIEKIARVAAAGVEQARAVQTEPSGAKSYENADGTRTIIGNIANGESNPSYTMATHVGDVTAPGTPTGVTASSKSGVVVVEWDGTLSGGVPDDFFCVRIYLDGSELGVLRESGSVSSAKLEGGTTHSVTATAEDDCCLPDGTPAHNVSAPTAAVSVTVSEGVESVAAIAQQALDVAEATGQYFWHNTGEEEDPIEADVDGGTGAHVTQFKREEWSNPESENYHSGPNSLWNSLGMLFRDGLYNLLALVANTNRGVAIYDGWGNEPTNIVASFSSDGQTIGKSDESHMFADFHSLQLVDKEGSAYFHVSDLRDEQGIFEYNESITYPQDTTLPVINGVLASFHIVEMLSVEVNGAEVSSSDYYIDSSGMVVQFNLGAVSLARGDVVSITYETDSPDFKAYTFGSRRGNVGLMSVAEGRTEASGAYSHAEGVASALGAYSHAEGGGSASGTYSHTEGRYSLASGNGSHAENGYVPNGPAVADATTAAGVNSHAEGLFSHANGETSHAQNKGTIAAGDNQTAMGTYNEEDTAGDYALIIGNGTAADTRSNAFTVDWLGNIWAAGKAALSGAIEAASAAISGALSFGGDLTVGSETFTNAAVRQALNSIRTAQTTMVLQNVGSGTHTLYLYRQGHFVFASMANAINPASANTAINAGTIPSGYRPAYTAFCSGNGMVSNTIGGWYYRWRVATGGQITLHISVTGSREAPISMCWFTNDAWPS